MVKTGRAVTLLVLSCIALPTPALQSPTPGERVDATPAPAQPLEEAPSPGPKTQGPPVKTPSPDTVTPSERIEADSAVSFPVDI